MLSDIPPIFFALAAALLFAVGAQLQNIALARIEPRRGAAISIYTTAIFFWMIAPWLLDGAHWSHSAVWIFALVGLFRPSVSANLASPPCAISDRPCRPPWRPYRRCSPPPSACFCWARI